MPLFPQPQMPQMLESVAADQPPVDLPTTIQTRHYMKLIRYKYKVTDYALRTGQKWRTVQRTTLFCGVPIWRRMLA